LRKSAEVFCTRILHKSFARLSLTVRRAQQIIRKVIAGFATTESKLAILLNIRLSFSFWPPMTTASGLGFTCAFATIAISGSAGDTF
jgi:hypothetical protein